jgi:hypothetical protein
LEGTFVKSVILAVSLATVAAPAMAAPAALAPQAAPAKTPVDPARLALAKVTVDSIWPIGTYERLMKDMMSNMQDSIMGRMLDSTAAELGIETESDDGKTLRQKISEKDPHFEERMRITNQVMGDEMIRLFGKMEPKLREGLANAYARRFTVAELAEINRFFASPAGASYARQSMELMTDKELMAEMMSAGPEFMKEMPAIIEKLKKATAHLPEPPKAEEEAEEEGANPVA